MSEPLGESSLPVPLTPLFGRDQEIADVMAMLDDDEIRLLSLTGPGGVGKTRLALAVASGMERDFADGATYISLAQYQRPDQVPVAVAQALGTGVHGVPSLVDNIVSALRPRQLLLVLDNYEHLLTTPPVWLSGLIASCPRLKVLVTSQMPLRLSGEHQYRVGPLATPEDRVDDATTNAAMALFVQRARAARADFELNDANIEAVSTLCRRLEGLPLAIELAAARINLFTPEQMLARLTDRFRLLTGGATDTPPRLRSMRDTIAWSHDLLSSSERRLFRTLSVFVGGFTFEGAEAMASAGDHDVISGISSLLDKSLIHMVDDGGTARFHMLEAIREFGLDQLEAHGDVELARMLLAKWCVSRVQDASPFDPASQLTWYHELESEYGNLHASLTWLDASNRTTEQFALLTPLRWFWFFGGREAEGHRWYVHLLDRIHDNERRALVLLIAGQFAALCDLPEAGTYLAESIALAQATGNGLVEADACFYFAVDAENHGDFGAAGDRFRRAQELNALTPNHWRKNAIAYHLGIIDFATGDLETAATRLEEVAEAVQDAGDPIVAVLSRSILALVHCELGQPLKAAEIVRQLLSDIRRIFLHDVKIMFGTAAVVSVALGDHRTAARLFGAMSVSGVVLALPERTPVERAERDTRAHLDESQFDQLWKEGRRYTPDQTEAVIRQLGLTGTGETVPEPASTGAADRLTRRELDVLKLLADGLSNQQIADTLSISKRTVAHHVASILSTLDVNSRTAAASYAIRHQIA